MRCNCQKDVGAFVYLLINAGLKPVIFDLMISIPFLVNNSRRIHEEGTNYPEVFVENPQSKSKCYISAR